MLRRAALLMVCSLAFVVTPRPPQLVPQVAARPSPAYLAVATPVQGTVQLALVRDDGRVVRRLTRVPGAAAGVVWSRQGNHIAFVHSFQGSRQIWIVPATGGPARRLTQPPGNSLSPTWSPDGRRLAFVSTRGGSPQVYVMNADGGNLHRVTREGAQRLVLWSPDGTHLAVVGRRGREPDLHLFVMRPDGSDARRVNSAPMLPHPGMEHPAWSPDGRRLAYVSRVGRAEQEITLASIDGAERRRLSTGYAPAWSPDGARLALVVPRVGDAQIYVTNADGTGTRRITRGQGIFLLPVWAPDGSAIAFVSIRDGDLDVSVMKPDGTGARRLLPTTGDLTGLPLFAWQPR